MNAPLAVDVTPQTWPQEVLEASRAQPVVVDFWAAWCGPCRTLGPVLERFAAQDAGRWKLVKVDVDAHPDLSQSFGVQGIPAVFALVDGEVVDTFTGALPPPQVRAWLDRVAPTGAALAARRGDAAWSEGRRDDARAHWEEALADDPALPGPRLGLAELAADAGELDAARALLQELPDTLPPAVAPRRTALQFRLGVGDVESLRAALAAAPDDLDARWDLAHALAASQAWDEALEHLLAIVRSDRGYRDDGARKAMLALFEVLGIRSETSDRWRSRLATVLY